MPYIPTSSYRGKPIYMLNEHWETIIPSMFFKGEKVPYQRERIELQDGDFLDIDLLKDGNKRCLIITHGLEGDSNRYYVRRTARYFHDRGWDIVAWNCRSCSGEMNRLPRFYHHGDTEDLGFVIEQALEQGYEQVVLFGYSMGGSISLKYLGERVVDPRIKGAVTFSVPCNLRASSDVLRKKENQVYEKRFLGKLIEKIKYKAEVFPDQIDVSEIDALDDFDTFHDRYTAPLHGFVDVDEFFNTSSCDRYMPNIEVPVFVGNALNDPMLEGGCYPVGLAEQSEHIHLETPK